jgi:nucleoid DNA-binding protein
MSMDAQDDLPGGERVLLTSVETPTLTKAELSELLFERLGLNKRESKDMVEAFFEIITEALVKGEDVKLSGFGNFAIRRKAPRPDGTRAPASRSLSRPAMWSPSTPAPSSRRWCRAMSRHRKTSSKVSSLFAPAPGWRAVESTPCQTPTSSCRPSPPSATSPSVRSASCAG